MAYIRNALQKADSTKHADVMGICTTKVGYAVQFKDHRSAEAARTNTDWLAILRNVAKIVKLCFGVVVYRTPTENITLPEEKTQSITKMMHENDLAARGFQIEDIAWLRNRDKPLGRSPSLGALFDSPNGARHNELVSGETYIGSIEPHQHKKKGCHNCQGIGH